MPIQTEPEALDRQDLLAGIRRIALEAGRDILRHYAEHKANGIDIRRKDDQSPVTAADEEAEAIILSGLAELTPDIPAISEESVARGETPRFGRRFWLVDPLDGTKEFLNRNGEFTVNIALIEDGAPVLGVVHAPAKGRLCFGMVPDHAFEQDIDPVTGAESAPRPLRVRAPGPNGLVVVASRTHRSQKTDEYLAAYPIKDFVVAGSSLKLCLIAAGEADLYPRHGDTMEWDIAAGHAVLRAAGGEVTDLKGKPLTYGKSSLLNPWFIARGDLPFTAPRR
jgi:3'(2'), 5'-bisphosphate nucleotidase